jgi:hypothetical protein
LRKAGGNGGIERKDSRHTGLPWPHFGIEQRKAWSAENLSFPRWYNADMNKASVVLDHFLEPVRQCLTREQARKLADFRADTATQAIIDELARKTNEGVATDKERAEYEAFVEAGDFIAILQAKAQEILAEA